MTSPANSMRPDREPLDLDDAAGEPPATDTIDVDSDGGLTLSVRLVVGYGSHVGVGAKILPGFYMIGRHRECQIRPKSHSVSRRHCLVQHESGVVRVFDLESKRGTYVNDVRIAPKKWKLLNHGDRLRCGSYWFNVVIYDHEVDAELDGLSETKGKNLVAGYSDVEVIDDVADANEVADAGESDIFDEEDFGANRDSDAGSISHSGKGLLEQAKSTAKESLSKKEKSQPSRLPKPKIQKNYRKSSSSSGRSFSLSMNGPDSWKILLASVAAIVVLGFLGRTVYKIQKGPPVKILRGID